MNQKTRHLQPRFRLGRWAVDNRDEEPMTSAEEPMTSAEWVMVAVSVVIVCVLTIFAVRG